MRYIWVGLVSLGLLGVTSPAWAACAVCSKADSASYPCKALGSLGQGVCNVGFGWLELIHQPRQAAQNGENVMLGIGKGIGQTVVRGLRGMAYVATFWVPPAHAPKLGTDCPIDVIRGG